MPPQNPPPEVFAFAVDPSLDVWNVPPRQWMQQHDKHWDGLGVATVVFDRAGRVLLLQRAAHDSMPNRWEVPGGAADQEDSDDNGNGGGSILRAAARELWEESGLVAQRYIRLVPQPDLPDSSSSSSSSAADGIPRSAATTGLVDSQGNVFTNRTGHRLFCRFAFHADVRSTAPVVLDPNEHQAYVWATADDVRQQRLAATDQPIPITTPMTQVMILEAFRLRAQQ